MKSTNFLNLDGLIFLTVVCLSASAVYGIPLYEGKFPQPAAKVVLPDLLEADQSGDNPMVHNDNYDMIMPDYYDQHSASSLQYQNFIEFYDPDMPDDGEYKMDETQFVHTNPVRAPQPLSAEERRIRQKLEDIDERREKKLQLKLKKGSTKPRHNAAQWDQFDYDLYSVNPDKKHKKAYYG